MKKRILSILLAALLVLALLPAAALAADAPERGTLSYEVAIQPQFDEAAPFYGGLAAVKMDGKWGYIDHDCNTVIPFTYDLAMDFHEGYAIVGILSNTYQEEIWGWNDDTEEYGPTGEFDTYNVYDIYFTDKDNDLNPFQYFYEGWEYSEVVEDYTLVSEIRPVQYTILAGHEPLDREYTLFHNGYVSLLLRDSDNMAVHALFNTKGEQVKLTVEDSTWNYTPSSFPVNEGKVITSSPYVYDGGWGVYDLKTRTYMDSYDIAKKFPIEILNIPSNIEIEDTSVQLRPFNQGLAPAGFTARGYDADDDYGYTYSGYGAWGFINTKGEWVIPSDSYSNFMVRGLGTEYEVFGDTGLAMVYDSNEDWWGAIDKTGKTVISFNYDNLYPYGYGLAAFQKHGKWGYLDADGNVAIPAQYELTSGFSSEGYAVAYDGSKAFLIDTKGNAIPGADTLDPDTYFIDDGDGTPTTYVPDDYVVIQENGKYGYGHITYKAPLPEKAEVNKWLYAEVSAAIEKDLVPAYLQNLYPNNITRNEFCDLVVRAIEKVLDKDIDDVVKEKTGKTLDSYIHQYPFTDTNNSNVVAAYALGIVQGRGGTTFDPYALISRQEAAAFLMRSAKVLGLDTSSVTDAGFSDYGKVGVWFKDAVNYVSQIKVMNGTGSGFDPEGKYTREMSFTTIYRLFNAVVNG